MSHINIGDMLMEIHADLVALIKIMNESDCDPKDITRLVDARFLIQQSLINIENNIIRKVVKINVP